MRENIARNLARIKVAPSLLPLREKGDSAETDEGSVSSWSTRHPTSLDKLGVGHLLPQGEKGGAKIAQVYPRLPHPRYNPAA
jgi:hypothetical protein